MNHIGTNDPEVTQISEIEDAENMFYNWEC